MIEIISGTNRPGSISLKISEFIHALYQELDVPSHLYSLEDLPAELFDGKAYQEKPASFQPIAEAILKSHGMVVIVPEYNGSFPGALKYFIDMLKFPESFEQRPVCFIGVAAGNWGGLRAVEQLQMVFGYRNAYIFPERVFIPGSFKILNDDGKLADEAIQERLRKQAQGFAQFVKKIKPTECSLLDHKFSG